MTQKGQQVSFFHLSAFHDTFILKLTSFVVSRWLPDSLSTTSLLYPEREQANIFVSKILRLTQMNHISTTNGCGQGMEHANLLKHQSVHFHLKLESSPLCPQHRVLCTEVVDAQLKTGSQKGKQSQPSKSHYTLQNSGHCNSELPRTCFLCYLYSSTPLSAEDMFPGSQ